MPHQQGMYMHACSVTQLCLTLCNPVDCCLPGFSVRGVFPGKNTGVGCHFLLKGIFLTQGSNASLLHCQVDSSPLNHLGSPYIHNSARICTLQKNVVDFKSIDDLQIVLVSSVEQNIMLRKTEYIYIYIYICSFSDSFLLQIIIGY